MKKNTSSTPGPNKTQRKDYAAGKKDAARRTYGRTLVETKHGYNIATFGNLSKPGDSRARIAGTFAGANKVVAAERKRRESIRNKGLASAKSVAAKRAAGSGGTYRAQDQRRSATYGANMKAADGARKRASAKPSAMSSKTRNMRKG